MKYKSYEELVTTRQETRKGFIEFALEKNNRSQPLVNAAKYLKRIASQARTPRDLLNIKEIETSLLTAAGISTKALKYFDNNAKQEAIEVLIEKFLEPVGDEFVDELVYRFLLIKGDTLGGSMRNLIGALAQKKLIRNMLSVLQIRDINFKWLHNISKTWCNPPEDNYGIEDHIKALYWKNNIGNRIFAFNLTNKNVDMKNIDLCLFNTISTNISLKELISDINSPIMFGELKGGIDPAGADEHWKTANSALTRIRDAYKNRAPNIYTSFIGAAIESSMAREIYNQLNTNKLDFAANLTKENQVFSFCEWIINL